ncbi:hypothetical protein [Armatimonas sp.]|uniref:hypothetical protein n=1 Tax=Armatimonas sp. TaxID=1872638 RepID=UPI00374FFC28
MKRRISLALISLCSVSGAHAQYIARKLNLTGFPQSATSVSGNRAVGTFGSQAGVRNREDAMLWDIRQGVPSFPELPTNLSYQQISGDWVLQSQFDFSIINVSSNRSFSAKNFVTGQVVSLGTSASANNSQGYTSVAPNLREGWAFTNTDVRAIAIGPYNTYSSEAVNLATGQRYGFTWGPLFSSFPRQILDVSGTNALVNFTATGFGFLDLPTGTITNLNTGLSSVKGMSGNYIVGARTGTGAASVYEIGSATTRDLAVVGTGASAVMVGANQTVGNATVSGSNRAVFWDNATGAATNLHGYLPTGYTSSSAVGIDKNFADGPLLIAGFNNLGQEDRFALRRFGGALTEIDTPELASFPGDYTQTGGVVSNAGTIQWTNPSGIYNLNGGYLYSTGSILGGISNGGGVLSGGLNGGGSGGGIGGFSASGGYGQGIGGTLLVNISSGSSFDTFSFGGNASFGGALEIALTGGFTPGIGQSFAFFAAPNIVGSWAQIVSPGYLWDVTYTPNSATAIFRGTLSSGSAAPEPSSLALALLAPLALLARRRYNQG